jgi:putative membrane protein
MLGIFSMWILHIPSIFNFIMSSDILYDLQILALILIGHVFLWPVFTPVNWNKLQPLGSAIYLFTACVGCTILGIFITFAPTRLFNLCEVNDAQMMNFMHSGWGLSPLADQELGGLIMWVPACLVYLTYIMITLGKWYFFNENEDKKRRV